MKKVVEHYSYFPQRKTGRIKHRVVDVHGSEVTDVSIKAMLYGLYLRTMDISQDVGNYDGADIVIYDDNSVDLVVCAHVNGAKKKEEPPHLIVRQGEFAFTCCKCGKKHLSTKAIPGFEDVAKFPRLRQVPKTLVKHRNSREEWEYFCVDCAN